MEKIVGKVIFIVLTVMTGFVFSSDSLVILRMQDMNHEPLKQVKCQAPFILQVELRNIEGYTDSYLMQHITGIENFKVSQSTTSSNVSIDNGKKTTKTFYNFVLRADQKGNFTVGPFVLKDKSGRHIKSNRLIVPSGDELVFSDKSQKDKYFFTISLNKNKAYIGERLSVNIKFYDRLYVDDLHLQLPDFTDFYMIESQSNPKKSSTVISGEEYSVTEWNFGLYPTQLGQIVVQDLYAVFCMPESESNVRFAGAFDFFRSLQKSQQFLTIKPVEITVLPLPEEKGMEDVKAVGDFTKYSIGVNQMSVAAGSGIVFTMELAGKGNFEMINLIPEKLPEGFRYYDAHNSKINGRQKYKRSEFVIQVDTPGSYHIEPQRIDFFNPTTQEYVTLYSNPLEITITPNLNLNDSKNQFDFSSFESVDTVEEFAGKSLDDFCLVTKGSIASVQEIMIPLSWYKNILRLLLLFWVLSVFYFFIFKKYFLSHAACQRFIIFYKANKAFRDAQKHKNLYKLYQVFSDLFASLLCCTPGSLNDFMILEYLAQHDFTSQEIEAWKNFYNKILKTSFSLHAQSDENDLFVESLQWLKQLKERS